MNTVQVERCLSFVNAQLRVSGKRRNEEEYPTRIRAVTISRQAGCGAVLVANKLVEYLQARTPHNESQWTVFDRNLVQKVLEEHNLPQRLAKFMPENWISEIEDIIDDLFGLHPPSEILVRQTAETILRLAKLGNVIIIGRGANVITAKLDSVFHVRLVAPLERRVERIQESDQLDEAGASELIRREDKGRTRYLKNYYHKDINDPVLYHLVINTGLSGYDDAAQIIETGAFGCRRPNVLPQRRYNPL
jgi:cytidylate kinase